MNKKQQMILVLACQLGLSFYFLASDGARVFNTWRLADDGKEVMAKVTEQRTVGCRKGGRNACEAHTLSADGREFHMVLLEKHPAGEQMLITYLPEDTSIVVPGPKTGSRWEKIYFRAAGQKDDMVMGLAGLGLLILGLGGLAFSLTRDKDWQGSARDEKISAPMTAVEPAGMDPIEDGQPKPVNNILAWATLVVFGILAVSVLVFNYIDGRKQDPPAASASTPQRPATGGKPAQLVPEKPVPKTVDPQQQQIVALVESGGYEELERLLGARQLAFEQDPATSHDLEQAFDAFRKLPRAAQKNLGEWMEKYPKSYVATIARAAHYLKQGQDARGGKYSAETPEENMRTMDYYFALAGNDLQRSLALSGKPYLSHRLYMQIALRKGAQANMKKHFDAAVLMAPASVDARLAYMRSLEPRWSGSYKEMEDFVAASRPALPDAKDLARLEARIPAYRAFDSRRANDLTQTLKFHDEAIALDADPEYLCGRAYVLLLLKRGKEAFADIANALAKRREEKYCLELAPSASRQAGDTQEAIRVLGLVIEADPNSVDALDQRGWRYESLGKPELAFADYLAAAKVGEPWAQLQAGNAYWRGNGVAANREEAMAWLRKSAGQGNAEAKLRLEQVLKRETIF